MDFSSIPRALESLQRRKLAEEQVAILQDNSSAANQQVQFEALKALLQGYDPQWEPLAVGLYIATEVLQNYNKIKSKTTILYVEGPRVPSTTGDSVDALPGVSTDDMPSLADLILSTCLQNLEHREPRIRTAIAKAIAAICPLIEREKVIHLHSVLVQSIHEHIVSGRDADANYSKSSTGALDDTTGWRAIETNWQGLAALIGAVGSEYWNLLDANDAPQLFADCEYSACTHVNRHVRAAAMAVLEHCILASEDDQSRLINVDSPLRATVLAALKTGLADNWSQVRMAASVLCRAYWKALKASMPPKDVLSTLIPRMCLNRFYLAQGVRLYSHETWKLIFPAGGVNVVVECLPAVVRYYVQMCDADNHVVREGACQAIAELAVRLGGSGNEQHYKLLEKNVPTLLQALLMCFHDESWPVRDEACLACATLCKSYPVECQPELETLYSRWTEQLTDQIWSVRQDAAVALGDALRAYPEILDSRIRALIKKLLPAALEQPAMSQDEYKAHVNDLEAHSNSQLYSCGSLAPKLRKGGAGRIGCSSCGIERPKAPWEATDGCIYLIREWTILGVEPNTKTPVTDEDLVPVLEELANVCRVQHFPQSHDLRATLWRTIPTIAEALGKERFKRKYLHIFMDLMFNNMDSSSASELSKHAAGQCAEELARLVNVSIFRGRLDDYQQVTFDRVMRERAQMPKMAMDEGASPFGPKSLLDQLNGREQTTMGFIGRFP